MSTRRFVFAVALACAVAVSVSWASPVPEPYHGDQRSYVTPRQQFLVLHPQVVGPQFSQLKYEQPIIAPITQLGHISTPKEQLYFFYPSSPLAQAPVVSFQRDDGQDFNLISFISNWFASKPAEAAAPVEAAQPAIEATQPVEAPAPVQPSSDPIQPAEIAASQLEPQRPIDGVGEQLRPGLFPDTMAGFSEPAKIELNPDAEFIPQNPQQPQQPQQPQPQPRPPQPAYAPFPLGPQLPDRRVYIVSGQPQFFGNFDAFANPLNPIFSLQPLSAIIPRSKEDGQVEAVEEVARDAIVPTPSSDLKMAPQAMAEEVQVVAGPEMITAETPVDVFARSNSRIEIIPSELEGLSKLQDAERFINDGVQDKSGGGAGEWSSIRWRRGGRM